MSLQATIDELALEPGYVLLGPACSWEDGHPASALCYRPVLKFNPLIGQTPGFQVGDFVLPLNHATQFGLESSESIWVTRQGNIVGKHQVQV